MPGARVSKSFSIWRQEENMAQEGVCVAQGPEKGSEN